MVLAGYGGRVVKVNLSTLKVQVDDISESIAKKFIGGLGLASYYFYKYLPNYNVDPLSPDNLLIIASGPFNGGLIPMSTKAILLFKSPQTNVLGASIVGGSFGSYMKWAGIDLIMITGRAVEPVYILINDGEVEIKSASHLWGKGSHAAENSIKEEIGDSASVLTIGPAGENMVKFACVNNDYWRQAGRTGGGAVFGSKRLKAIAIRASPKASYYYDSEKLRELVAKVHELIRSSKPIQGYSLRGTVGAVEVANVLGYFPTRYWSKVKLEDYEKVSWEAYKDYRVKRMTCIGCPVACHQYVEIRDSRYGLIKVSLEYENIFAIAGLCEISDSIAVAYLNAIIDDYGLDTISTGNVIAFAIEAFKRGRLKLDREIDYGDVEGFTWLLEKVVRREGVGEILAEGVAKAAEKLKLNEIAVHVKGLEPPGYDPRTLKGMILSYAVSFRGACHLRMMGYHADLMGLGGGRYSASREKVEILIDLENRGAMYDSLPLCKFGRFIYDWDLMAKLLNAATGFNYEVCDLKKIAERIITLTRLINVKFGVKRNDDKLPLKFFIEPVAHEGERKLSEKEVENMISTYYAMRGWNESGMPKKEKIAELELG